MKFTWSSSITFKLSCNELFWNMVCRWGRKLYTCLTKFQLPWMACSWSFNMWKSLIKGHNKLSHWLYFKCKIYEPKLVFFKSCMAKVMKTLTNPIFQGTSSLRPSTSYSAWKFQKRKSIHVFKVKLGRSIACEVTKMMVNVCVDNSGDKLRCWKMLLKNSKLFWRYFKLLFKRGNGKD